MRKLCLLVVRWSDAGDGIHGVLGSLEGSALLGPTVWERFIEKEPPQNERFSEVFTKASELHVGKMQILKTCII